MTSESFAVKLRPVRESDLPTLERIDTNPELSEPFEWRGFTNSAARRQRWEADGYPGERDALLIISLLDDTPAGIMNWRSIASSGPPGVFAIGILLLPDHRGKGYGTIAQRLLVDYLFATTPANRIEATTEVDNLAEQRALEKAGFVREGMLRGRGFVRGEWRDGLMYSRLRDDPPPEDQEESVRHSLVALGLAVNVLLVDCGSPLTATSKLTDADFDDSGYVPVDPFDADGRSELIDGTPIHPLLIAAATGLAKFTIPNLRRYVLDAKSRIVDNQG